MDPRLNDSEEELQAKAREAARAVKEAAATIDVDDSTPRELLAGLGEAGVLGTCVSEAYGGGEEGRVGVALVCEELGAASAGVAALVVAHFMASSMLEALADESLKQEVLPGLGAGAKIAAVALDGGVSLLDDPAVTVVAKEDGDAIVLQGTARAVAAATAADIIVVPATTAGGGLQVAAVDAGAPGLSVDAVTGMMGLNGSATGAVDLADAAARSMAAGDADAALAGARDLARIGHAALCVGIGRAALEASTAYVVGSEAGLDRAQSVQWMLADMATETEAARLLTWYAASRTDAGELREAAAMARVVAADAAVGASRRAVQIFGAAGNQRSSGVERLYRDAKAMEVHHGALESQRRAVARELLPDLFEDAPAG